MLQLLSKVFPRKTADLEANLIGIAGFTGHGEVEFTSWSNGTRQLEVELRGVAGRVAEIHINDRHIASVSLENGRADKTFDTRAGDQVTECSPGAQVQIRQNGDIILEGALRRD